MTNNIPRIKWIDSAKGIAIILVVIGHVYYFYVPGHGYDNSIVFDLSHRIAYSFHMPLFMLLSGIVYGKYNARGNIRKKIISYGIPYLCFSILAWISNKQLSVSDLFLIPLYPIGFMWFIYALLIMTLVQIHIGQKRTVLFKIMHLVVAFLLLLLCPYVDNIFSSIRFHDLVISDVMRWYFYYLLGVYGCDMIIRLSQISIYKLTGLFFFCSSVFIITFLLKSNFSLMKILMAISGSMMVICICMICKNQVIEYVGKRSLPVYVLHNIFISLSQKILVFISGFIVLNDIIEWIVCVVLGTILPILIYEIVTKVKYLDFCFLPLKYIK